MTDLEHKHNRLKTLSAGNDRSFNELREATGGRFGMDTGDVRREMMFDKMIEWGIITEEQRLDFEIEFHENVEKALDENWVKYREANTQPKLSVVKQSTSLVDQNGRPLT